MIKLIAEKYKSLIERLKTYEGDKLDVRINIGDYDENDMKAAIDGMQIAY